MKLAIMQPTYLPWMGYFDLMDQVDVFIFLDDVQFSKQSWQQKNRIKIKNGKLLLTVPVKNKSKKQIIKDVIIDNSRNWQKKHLTSIKLNYSKSKYYNQYIKSLEEIYMNNKDSLVDLNMKINLWIKESLNIKCKVFRASELGIDSGEKVMRLINICKKMGCNEYLSPAGSKGYIEKNNIFEKEGIKLSYQHFVHPIYNQINGDFLPYMSVIDLLFNEGDNALNIIREGHKDENRNQIMVN